VQHKEAPPLGGYLYSPTHQHRPKTLPSQAEQPEQTEHKTHTSKATPPKPVNQTPQNTDKQYVSAPRPGNYPRLMTYPQDFHRYLVGMPNKTHKGVPRLTERLFSVLGVVVVRWVGV